MLPRKNGSVILESLVQAESRPAILIISGKASGLDLKQAQGLGANGLVSKEDRPEEVLIAIQSLRAGERYLAPVICELVQPLELDSDTVAGQNHLTAREREVLALVAEGLSNDGIGQELKISPMTAKNLGEISCESWGSSLRFRQPAPRCAWVCSSSTETNQ